MTYFEPKKRENPSEKRVLAILMTVNKKRGIHHNALRKIIVDEKHVMAKRTFDKIVKELREKGTLATIPMGDNKIHYVIPQAVTGESMNFEKDFEVFLKLLETKIKKLKKDYKKLPIQGKQTIMISSLSNVFSSIVGISLINSISDSSINTLTDQEIRLRKMVKEHVNIIMHDIDANMVIGVVNDSILSSFTATQFLQMLKINSMK